MQPSRLNLRLSESLVVMWNDLTICQPANQDLDLIVKSAEILTDILFLQST